MTGLFVLFVAAAPLKQSLLSVEVIILCAGGLFQVIEKEIWHYELTPKILFCYESLPHYAKKDV